MTKWLRGPDEMASRAAFGPRAVVWRPCFIDYRYKFDNLITVMWRVFHCSLHVLVMAYISENIQKAPNLNLSPLGGAVLRCVTYFDKIGQIDLKLTLVEKCWLRASIVTCKPGLVGLGFFHLRVHSVIPYLRPLVGVYFENCITKPYHVGHPHFYCSATTTTSKLQMQSRWTTFQYSHCQVVQFRLTSLLIDTFTTIITNQYRLPLR